jgi:hypothetical protein
MVGSCIFAGFGNKKISKILNNVNSIQEFVLNDKLIDKTDIVNKIRGLEGFFKTADTFYENLLTFKEYYEDVKDIFMLHYETKHSSQIICIALHYFRSGILH